jgi:bifunctional DNA-binding transcriptional regulator/antitoxin component of YhaV-PrlF toxin-antitoxin module
MTWRVQLKPAPLDGAMVIIPDEVLKVFGWKVGAYLRLVVDADGHLALQRYHKRKGEGEL